MADRKTIDWKAACDRTICSREFLKESLMRRAENGDSIHTPEQMSLLIEWRLSANNITPDDQKILLDINPHGVEDQPRSIMMLNALARDFNKGTDVRTTFEYIPSSERASFTIH